MSIQQRGSLPQTVLDETPEGWSRNREVEGRFGATGVFEHDSGWRITVRRYDAGWADGEQVCRALSEDDDQLVAPIFETTMVALTNEYETHFEIQTDEMDEPDRIPLDGCEAQRYADPDGKKLLADLQHREAVRQERESGPSLAEELREDYGESA